jgi:hypothetical protein
MENRSNRRQQNPVTSTGIEPDEAIGS